MSSFAGFVRRYVVVALAVFALVAATFTPGTAAPREQPVTVIVRTTGEPVALQSAGKAQSGRAEARALEERLRAAHDRVLEEARTRGLSVAREHDYTSVYSGMAVRVAPSQVEQLRTLPGVVAVYPDTRYRADLDVSVPFIGAPKVWERTDAEGDNVTGKGTIVSVIDTGIDYTHPDLGGGFGPDHKVVAGYDFVNDDADPMDDNAHGTHVAGIIAGDGGIKGVAPGAELTAYKVLNERGFGELSDIMAAIDAASDPANPYRADVINMSLGAFGDGYDPLSQAANNASDAGVVVVASAGNSGPGYETVGSPAAAEKVLAVGASITGLTVPKITVTSPERKTLDAERRSWSANAPSEPVTAEVVDVGWGFPEDYEGKDVRGKAVLIRSTPGDYWTSKIAEEHGAVATLHYRTDGSEGPVSFSDEGTGAGRTRGSTDRFPTGPGFATGDYGHLDVVSVLIFEQDAVDMQSQLEKGRVEVTIEGEDATDQIAGFSSRGPGPSPRSWRRAQRSGRRSPRACGSRVTSTSPAPAWPLLTWRGRRL